MSKINNNVYTYFNELFQFLEKEVFQEKLCDIFFTLQYKKTAYGFFQPNAFKLISVGKNTHQISMNPQTFTKRTELEIQSTFLHEMVHLWDELFGKPGKQGYHGKMWAMKMHEVGLKPISLDNPEKETGFKCTHDIKDDGIFLTKIKEFKASVPFDFVLPDREPQLSVEYKPRRTRKPYRCFSCNNGVSVKVFEDEVKHFNLKCNNCNKDLEYENNN